MPIRKKGDIEIQTSAKGTKSKSTGFTFYSYDKNSAALYFNFREENGEPTDLANATIRLVFVLNDEKITPKTDDIEIWLAVPGTARYIIPDNLLGYEGKVTSYVYLDFSDGSHTDEGHFTFEIKRSLITDVIPEAGDKYVKDFEDIKAEVQEAADGAKETISQKATEFSDTSDSAISKVNQAADDTIKTASEAKSDVQDSADQVNKDYEAWKAEQEEQQTTFESDTNETINGINTKVEETQTKVSDLEKNADDLATKQYVDESVEGFNETNEKLTVASVTLNVPTDFPTLASAFYEIESKIYATRASVYVNIETGHQITEGVILKARDYRRVTIQSEDDIVEVADGFTGDVLKGSDCNFPIFNLLVDMKKLGSFGLGLYGNANATVNPDCGVINAGNDGVFVNRLSQLYAHEANFSGANRYGLFVDHANTVYARYINLDNCKVGLRATKGSVVEVANASIKNCRNAILATEGSKVIGITDPSEPTRHLDVSGSSGNAIDLTSSAEFVADKVIIEDCGTGIVARSGSKVVCSGTGIVNCGQAMKLSKKSTAYMGEFYMNTITETAISLKEGAFLQAESSECHVDGVAFTIKSGSRVNLDGSDLTNCGTPVRCTEGSHANCYNVDATGHTANHGFYVYHGSTINAVGASGDLRVTANTLTSDGYIIQ